MPMGAGRVSGDWARGGGWGMGRAGRAIHLEALRGGGGGVTHKAVEVHFVRL